MKTLTLLFSLLLYVSLLSGCQTTGGPRTKTILGAGGGAAAGGLLGAALGGGAKGIAAGTILGGLLGAGIGDRLDAADGRHMQHTTMQVLETAPVGPPVVWRNPDSGTYGQVVATRTSQIPQTGPDVREYQQTVAGGGQEQQAYGTACRQPDGSWKGQEGIWGDGAQKRRWGHGTS